MFNIVATAAAEEKEEENEETELNNICTTLGNGVFSSSKPEWNVRPRGEHNQSRQSSSF